MTSTLSTGLLWGNGWFLMANNKNDKFNRFSEKSNPYFTECMIIFCNDSTVRLKNEVLMGLNGTFLLANDLTG